MKAYLMHPGRDFDTGQKFPPNAKALTQDLELTTLLNAMAGGDSFLLEVAHRALMCGVTDPETITYRQQILRDCLSQPAVVRAIYDITVQAIGEERRIWWGIGSRYPSAILNRAVNAMNIFVAALKRLRDLADSHASGFRSEGFTRFFGMIEAELDDDYFALVAGHLKQLKFRDGVLVSARPGEGNAGTGYLLRRPRPTRRGLAGLVPIPDHSAYTLTVSDRDEAGARALAELSDQGINHVANALAQSADHILSFFRLLRTELAFYIGALNAHERLAAQGEQVCFPEPLPPAEAAFSAAGLYDPCLALSVTTGVVGSDVSTDGKPRADHRRQPGREIHVPAQRRPGPADDAVRYVRGRHRAASQRLPGPVHPLQARRRRHHDQRQTGRGAGQDERCHRAHNAGVDVAVQRVVRVHQRARRLTDRPPDRPRPARRRHPGVLCHPPL